MTSGLETEWDYSGRKGRDRQKKKISKANEREKPKRGKDEEVNGQGGKRGAPTPYGVAGGRMRVGLCTAIVRQTVSHTWYSSQKGHRTTSIRLLQPMTTYLPYIVSFTTRR